MASISPSDIEWVDCHGQAGILSDAVECTALAGSFRPDADDSTVLALCSTKTTHGYTHETNGCPQLFRILYGNKSGTMTATQHLMELNPHIEIWNDEAPVIINTEAVPNRTISSFAGATGRSLTGSMVHCILWGEVSTDDRQLRNTVSREGIMFWPGGGGEEAEGTEGVKSYSICGSWSSFNAVDKMEQEEDGVFGYTMSLGVNLFENFKILVNGSRQKVLHPGTVCAPSNIQVLGPDVSGDCENYTWMIDGREGFAAVAPPRITALAAEDSVEDSGDGDMAPEVWYVEQSGDRVARVGDEYRIRLHVAGKWRTVDWQRLGASKTVADEANIVDIGSYYVAATWNSWTFQHAMSALGDGVYVATVEFKDEPYGEFAIVRNEDWNQTFYPNAADLPPSGYAEGAVSTDAVEGPDYAPGDLRWPVWAVVGHKIKIVFTRKWIDGVEIKKIAWSMV